MEMKTPDFMEPIHAKNGLIMIWQNTPKHAKPQLLGFLFFVRFVASPLQLLNVLEKTDWRLWIFRRFHRDSSRWRKLLPTFDPLWCIKNQPGDCTWSDLLLKPFSFRGEMTNVREAPLMTVYTRSPSEIRILDAWKYGCCKIGGNHLDMFDEKIKGYTDYTLSFSQYPQHVGAWVNPPQLYNEIVEFTDVLKIYDQMVLPVQVLLFVIHTSHQVECFQSPDFLRFLATAPCQENHLGAAGGGWPEDFYDPT